MCRKASRMKEPRNPEWPGIPLEKWAPNLKVEEQSQVIGYAAGENRFIDLPIPSRIILLGDKLDTVLERMLRGISRLSSVPLSDELIDGAIALADKT
jgi:hypothetical protein